MPAGGFAVRSRAAWASCLPATGGGGASLDWDRRRRVTPVQTASQEAWPEADLGDEILPEMRAAVERRQMSAPSSGASRIARCGGVTSVCRRSAFPSFLREDKSKWRVVDREENFSQFAPRPARNSDADRVVRMRSRIFTLPCRGRVDRRRRSGWGRATS